MEYLNMNLMEGRDGLNTYKPRSRGGGGMSTKGKRPMRALTAGDKIEAIQRVNDGESKASVARDIGVPESTLRGWCKNENKLRYMSSRLSSPDTDRSTDGEPTDKRARTESPPAAAAPPATAAPPTTGLDLSAAPAPAAASPPAPAHDAPVELTTRRADPPPPARRADPGASVSMSAISPLSGLAPLPPLSHSHLGLSFNDIASNLSLLAQFNPGLTSALAAAPASRALRSVRSPKPAHSSTHGSSHGSSHSSALNLSDRHRGGKSHHSHSESYHGRAASDPVDDTLWYWLKTQQAMLDLTAQAAAPPLALGEQAPRAPAPAAPVSAHLDYNRNSWIWQYYKQFGGAMPPPEDKHKPASQVPKDKSVENILYSQLVKGKSEEEERASETRGAGRRARGPAASPGAGAAHREPVAERPETQREPAAERPEAPREPAAEKHEARRDARARTVLDSLLFSSAAAGPVGGSEGAGPEAEGEWAAGAGEALQHGDKFLAWLETSGDPSVTRMHVHQLRALLHNLRARRPPPAAAPAHADHSRRK